MHDLKDLICNFFTHKDFLPPAEQIAGTLFTPLHLVFSTVCILIIVFLCCSARKCGQGRLRKWFAWLWIVMVVLEVSKILWETYSGSSIHFEAAGILPFYPCSIFMYAMPFAIWGKGYVRKAACGYVCSLGLLGGLINFIYPANILSNYSCISFAGFHTFLYHGTLVFCAFAMLLSGYHSYTWVTKWWQLLIPALPCLCVSVAANLVNFSKIDSDYMFFKLESFFFAPIGQATPDVLSTVVVYAAYLLIHALPYIPGYLSNIRKAHSMTVSK